MIRTTRKEDAEDQLIVSLIKDKTELIARIELLKKEINRLRLRPITVKSSDDWKMPTVRLQSDIPLRFR